MGMSRGTAGQGVQLLVQHGTGGLTGGVSAGTEVWQWQWQCSCAGFWQAPQGWAQLPVHKPLVCWLGGAAGKTAGNIGKCL